MNKSTSILKSLLFVLAMGSTLPALADRYRCDDGSIISGGDCPDGGMSHIIAPEVTHLNAPEVTHLPAPEVTHGAAPQVTRYHVEEVTPVQPSSGSDSEQQQQQQQQQQCNFTPISSTPPNDYEMQELRISGLACQGVRCEINQERMDFQAKVNVDGGNFAPYQGNKLALTIVDSKTRSIVSRRAFFVSYGDGTISTWIEATLMPNGVFSFGITPICSSQVLAVGRFTISRTDHHRSGGGSSSSKGPQIDPLRYCSPNCFYTNPTINIH